MTRKLDSGAKVGLLGARRLDPVEGVDWFYFACVVSSLSRKKGGGGGVFFMSFCEPEWI